MAKFKCKLSGVVIEFTSDVDIKSMQGHPEYDRLDDEGNAIPEVEEDKPLPMTAPKRVGRPAKAK